MFLQFFSLPVLGIADGGGWSLNTKQINKSCIYILIGKLIFTSYGTFLTFYFAMCSYLPSPVYEISHRYIFGNWTTEVVEITFQDFYTSTFCEGKSLNLIF